MGISLGHLILVLVVMLIFFGAKRLPEVMKDLAKGYRAFIDGVKEESPSKDTTPQDKAPQDKE